MSSIVPQANRGSIGVLMAQPAQTGRAQHESPGDNRFGPNPTRGQYSQKVTAREQQDVSAHSPHSLHHAVCPSGHLLRRFTAGAAIAEQLPVRALGKDVNREAALVLAIIPFDQVTVRFSHRAEPGQFARAYGPTQRAREYLRESRSVQPFTKPSRHVLSALGEGQIGEPCVLTGNCPGRFAVPGQVNDRKGPVHVVIAPNGLFRLSRPYAAAPTNAARVVMT